MVREGRAKKAGKAIGELGGGGRGLWGGGDPALRSMLGVQTRLAVTEGIATWHVF